VPVPGGHRWARAGGIDVAIVKQRDGQHRVALGFKARALAIIALAMLTLGSHGPTLPQRT
jgi:hypothetical protein